MNYLQKIQDKIDNTNNNGDLKNDIETVQSQSNIDQLYQGEKARNQIL